MKTKRSIISPNGKYICHIGKILEINKAAFGAKFYFTDNQGNILYHIRNSYLHELQIDNEANPSLSIDEGFKLLQWSKDGNSVYFLQYSILASIMYYKSVFIDFPKEYVYIINENDYRMKIVNDLSILERPFDMQMVQGELNKLKLYPMSLSGNVSD